ncbi:Glycosyltransferase involved in cell wall bisynthesis [Rhizobium sp. RU35A]|uniref:glycosyltransferase family 4 protein n=1 Tax=Rhizobium sp. RU35A TaxID=1907414 RepID=UPI000953B455|nr:glycosyltransferase family 4 protein [Rhizobium sp. RU35A]SIQ94150.1 Glycosyltransferase involved in cell wall bisynthesis [Rhizobium sp. RU35A]
MTEPLPAPAPEPIPPIDPATPARVLQLVTHDKLGGVRVLVSMVSEGLRERGYLVEERAVEVPGRLATLANMAALARDILAGRYHVIFTYQAAASIFGNAFGFLRKVPVRAAHHTASPEGIRPHWRRLDRAFGTLGLYTHMIVNSDATRDAFAAWPARYRARFVDIPHGVDPLPPAAHRIDWRRRLAIPAGEPLLVATGRLVDQKDHATAVRALARLPEVHLAIAGDGPEEQALKTLATTLGVQHRLHLVGPLKRADLGDFFAAATLYLFPSVWETFGLAGVEAAMAGLPLVAADLPVLREVLSKSDAPANAAMTRFHAVGDEAGLAAAVVALLGCLPSAEIRDRYAADHRRHHSRQRMLTLYAGFLEAALRQTAKQR